MKTFRVICCLLIAVMNCSFAQTTVTYHRALSLAPNITESIYAIGAQSRLMGVSDFDHYPPAVEKLPKCGGWSNPNFETMRALRPDIMFVLGQHEKVRQFAAERGIRVEGLKVESIADIPKGFKRLGKLLDAEAGATSASLNFERTLAAIKKGTDGFPKSKRPKVFLCVGRAEGSLANLTTVPKWSFLSEALELAGGINVFGDLQAYYPSISKEALLARRPDVIIELREGAELTPDQATAATHEWDALGAVPAVKDQRVYVLSASGMLIPGPRLPDMIGRMQEVLLNDD